MLWRRLRLPLKAMAVFLLVFVLFLMPTLPVQRAEQSPTHAPRKKPPEAMVLPICGEPGGQLRRIGWGKFGPQFDVPSSEFEVLGGEPDVDYVRYLIKPKSADEYMELWFGPYAFNPEPDKELLENSITKQSRKIVTADGKQVGQDSSGKLRTGEAWRHVFLTIGGMEGAEYKASTENGLLFDRIIDSACYVPSAE